jgi:hypothetical protein
MSQQWARVGAAVLASLAVVGGITGASGALTSATGPDPDGPEPRPRPARTVPAPSYDPAPLPSDEVVRRCTNQLRSSPDLAIRTATGWQLSPPPGPLRVGAEVRLSAGRLSATCTIPQADWAAFGSGPTSIPVEATRAPKAVLEQCGRVAGYDFSAWTVASATAAAEGFAAVLRSSNDYHATCELGPLFDGPRAQRVAIAGSSPTPPLPYLVRLDTLRRDSPALSADNQGTVYTGAGVLYDPTGRPALDAATVELELPDGTVVARPVIDATYALRAFQARLLAEAAVTVTVLDADGWPLARYEAGTGQG